MAKEKTKSYTPIAAFFPDDSVPYMILYNNDEDVYIVQEGIDLQDE